MVSESPVRVDKIPLVHLPKAVIYYGLRMPRTCTVCNHSKREPIERALLAGESYRHIAARFGTSSSALVRHKADHLPASLMRAHDAEEILRADSLLDNVRHGEDRAERLYNAAEAILGRALAAKDLRTALQAIRAAADVRASAPDVGRAVGRGLLLELIL